MGTGGSPGKLGEQSVKLATHLHPVASLKGMELYLHVPPQRYVYKSPHSHPHVKHRGKYIPLEFKASDKNTVKCGSERCGTVHRSVVAWISVSYSGNKGYFELYRGIPQSLQADAAIVPSNSDRF
jgi:hypothetical protein